MTPRELEEYRALRSTIRDRGTARVYVFVGGLAVWAALGLTVAVLMAPPVETLLPLMMLAATFEAMFALHTGVERIGRYLQVFHEASDERAAWEATAMTFGGAARGTASDPLFTVYVAIAALVNFVPVLLASPVPVELGVMGVAHLAFLARVIAARNAAKRQRAADLARFTEMKNRQ